MPLLQKEIVKSPFWQFNGHLQTIIPNVTRKVDGVVYTRERIDTWDDDFLDLDWSCCNRETLVIISHGLAGSSEGGYMKGFVKAVNSIGWDALAWNYRGCSGEPNRKLASFHGGKTDDLAWVIRHAASRGYSKIHLIGVSMGGNITLKLLGEWKERVPKYIGKTVAVSVPVQLMETSLHLVKGWNKIYSQRYMKQYKEMLAQKESLFPNAWNFKYAYEADNLHTFVERFTAPSFGFSDAEDYLNSQSALHFLPGITVPALLINADNDPFLTKSSYPEALARQSDFFHLLITRNGGHIGYAEQSPSQLNWIERRALEFLST
jgi:uncharacterized protein